jgi:hypothetical protein
MNFGSLKRFKSFPEMNKGLKIRNLAVGSNRQGGPAHCDNMARWVQNET